MPSGITVTDNGPIRIEGDFEICDPAGVAFGLAGRTAVWLCRCGLPRSKPFCDGAHRAGFFDQRVARELPPPKPKV